MNVESGYIREGRRLDPQAVRWWFYAVDGYGFARGGRVRTEHQARVAIVEAERELWRERAAR